MKDGIMHQSFETQGPPHWVIPVAITFTASERQWKPHLSAKKPGVDSPSLKKSMSIHASHTFENLWIMNLASLAIPNITYILFRN